MKKKYGILSLMLLLLMFITACGSKSEALRKLYDANQFEDLMQKYESLHFTSEFYGGNNTESYYTEEITYANYADLVELKTEENEWVYFKDEDMLCRVWHVMTDGEKKKFSNLKIVVLGTEILDSKILEVTENSDHTIIHTKMSAQKSVLMLRNEFPDLPKDYYSHDIECVYEVKTEDYLLLSERMFIVKDGEEITLVNMEMECDGDQPKSMLTMLEDAKAYQELAEHPDNKKIVTMHYDAGSKHEETFTCTVDQKCMLQPIYRDGYMANDAKTERFTDEDGVVHLDMYIEKVD